MKYVSAYVVTRHYGGPEEGGWWFDAGELLATVPVRNDKETKVWEVRLQEYFGEVEGDISSVCGGEEIRVSVSDEIGKDWPDQAPHYE